MTHAEAEQLLGILVGGTSGWTSAADETFQVYTNQMSTLRDVELAAEAVEQLIRTWTDARRPSVAAIFSAYRDCARRHEMDRPALPPVHGRIPPLDEGRRIAAQAYANECAARPVDDALVASGWRSHEPSSRTVDSLLGIIGQETP